MPNASSEKEAELRSQGGPVYKLGCDYGVGSGMGTHSARGSRDAAGSSLRTTSGCIETQEHGGCEWSLKLSNQISSQGGAVTRTESGGCLSGSRLRDGIEGRQWGESAALETGGFSISLIAGHLYRG